MSNQLSSAHQATAPKFTIPTTWQGMKDLQIATTKLLRDHDVRLARNKYAALHGTLDPAQPDQWFIDQAMPPGEETQKKYMGRGQKLFEEAGDLGEDVWSLMEKRSGSARSWNTGKAALRFFLAKHMREVKREIDKLMDKAVAGAAYRKLLKTLVALASALAEVPTGKPAKFLPGSGFKQAHRSKSLSARHASEDWRERIAAALPKNYRAGWLIQCATGCRPKELANGVKLMLLPDGGLAFRVTGAKVGKRSGQQWRDLNISADEAGVVKMLAGLLKPGRPVSFQLPCLVNTYGRAVARCCRKVFPNDDPRKLLTAYSARHQRKADWKKAGMNRVDLAMALGHRTTRSAVFYGRRVRGRASAVKPLAVRAADQVKVRPHLKRPAVNSQVQALPAASRAKMRRP